jgi:alpha-galactosidase
VQLDDGYYRAFGDWEGNERFPHGMKYLASEIKKLGLRPGLWIAPYCISKDTDVAKNHPDWLLRDPNGKIQDIEPAHQGQAQYILDITHPGARQWFSDLFHTITRDWGYEFVKTDFVEWTVLSAQRYHDPHVTKAQAYRLGCQLMRDAMGPDVQLLDCGPGPTAVGLIDSMRIELDRPTPENPLWDQYAGHYNSTGPAVARRYYFHNRTWVNDADHLRLAGLTIPQGQAAATITALSGGHMISGDKLYDLDAPRLDILKKVLPSIGKSVRPIDLFEKAEPELFLLQLDDRWLLGCFNWKSSPAERDIDLMRLGLSGEKTYLLHEFWTQRLSETKGAIHLSLAPTSVQLFSICEKPDHPQVVGTDRHFGQGAIELQSVRWDAQARTLSGLAIGKAGMSWTMAVFVPSDLQVDGLAPGLFELSRSGTLLRAHVRFESIDRVPWLLKFK